MAADFEGSVAFKAACDLVFEVELSHAAIQSRSAPETAGKKARIRTS